MTTTSVSFLLILFHVVRPYSFPFDLFNTDEKSCYTKPSNYEVRAVLIPCHPHPHQRRRYCGQAGKLQGFDSNVCEQGKLKNCVKKVVITVRMTNLGHTNCESQYVVVDEVYDCQTDTKQKLLYPYVLKIKQEPLLQTYRLDCESSVKERCRAMEGMDEGGRKYSRRRKKPWMQKIPWVECDNRFTYTIQKVKRSARSYGDMNNYYQKQMANTNPYLSGGYPRRYYDTEPVLKDKVSQYNYGKFSNYMKDYGNANQRICPALPADEVNERKKRILPSGNVNSAPFGIEGEKDVLSSIDFPVKSPPNAGCDSLSGYTSPNYPLVPVPKSNCYENCALCNMRYYIYKLQEPIVKHHFSLEIFEKHHDIAGGVQWNIVTDDKPLFLGTYDTEFWGGNDTFVAGYSSKEPPLRNFALAFDCVRLLIPQFPYLRGGAGRFLLIPEGMFIRKQECFDSSGVHYGAHEKYVTKSSALKYPPKWFWCQDYKREQRGFRGNFFLKNFAKLPPIPLHNTTDCFQNLTFYYEGPHQSFINIEIKADFNMMLKPHSSAVITEVYVDATHCEKTDITVKVTNTGLVYAAFYVFLTDCPLRLPAGFSNIATSSAIIPPQQQHIFAITVLFPLPQKKFYCSVDVKNYRHDVLAFRRIRFQKSDRCICIWHCCCTCLEADKGLKCHPLPIDHYNAAGFYGGLPIASKYIMSTSFVEEYLILMFNLCLTMTLLLLILGILKAVIGLCYPPIGRFGLEWYLGLPKSIDRYYESNLTMTPEQYDKLSWPINPDKKKPCRPTSISVEFTINVFFFLLYPLVLLHAVVVKVFTPEYSNENLDSKVKNARFQQYKKKPCPCPMLTPPKSPKSCMKRSKK